jgi:hypothetical protein
MIRTASVYQRCQELFTNYPLAVRNVTDFGSIRTMVLMRRNGDEADFFVLSQGRGDEAPLYSMRPWPSGDIVDIDADGAAPVSRMFADALAAGLPLPRHGSMCGWKGDGVVTALIVIYTDYAPHRPLPRWTVMPLVGLPEREWPPFTGQRFFGPWFWEAYRAESIVALDEIIAEAPGSVFWVNTQSILGSDCCAVARKIEGPNGPTLPRGRYVYSEVLRSRGPVPSLAVLLADVNKIDMAARFRRSLRRDCWPRGGN